MASEKTRQSMEEAERADEQTAEVERERTRLARKRTKRISEQAEEEEDSGQGQVAALKQAFHAIDSVVGKVAQIADTVMPGFTAGLRHAGDIGISGLISEIPGVGQAGREVQAALGGEAIVEQFAQRLGQAGGAMSSERIVELMERQTQILERGLEQRDRVRSSFWDANPEVAAAGAGLRVWDAIKKFIF
jgi:hypothetical protein